MYGKPHCLAALQSCMDVVLPPNSYDIVAKAMADAPSSLLQLVDVWGCRHLIRTDMIGNLSEVNEDAIAAQQERSF